VSGEPSEPVLSQDRLPPKAAGLFGAAGNVSKFKRDEPPYVKFWGAPQSDSNYHHGRVNDRQTITITPGARFPSTTTV
jgi:hypothetical protein